MNSLITSYLKSAIKDFEKLHLVIGILIFAAASKMIPASKGVGVQSLKFDKICYYFRNLEYKG